MTIPAWHDPVPRALTVDVATLERTVAALSERTILRIWRLRLLVRKGDLAPDGECCLAIPIEDAER